MLAIPFPNFDPIAIAIGPLAIRWYALAYIVGLLLGWRYCLWLAKRPPAVASPTAIDDFLVWATLGVVLGGRFGYVLFYKPGFYFENPSEILAVWHGGMSFHGGALGVLVALVLFCRQRSLSLLAFADVITAAVPIGLFFGRIANFVNGELWGRVTDVPWGVVFPNAGVVPRHPSELYEAGTEGLILFLILFYLVRFTNVREKPGFVTGVFLIGYACARIFCEFFREPDAFLGDNGFLWYGATMGELLSIPVFLLGAWVVWRAKPDVIDRVPDDFAARLIARIRDTGPLSLSDYMRDCNAHYYATRDPFGAAGDFTTAPEISQVFGELIGAWCADYWQRMGAPNSFLLVELGPGRGTLMADALRATRRVPGFHDALTLHLVEQSPVLRKMQQEKLAAYAPQFHDTITSLPPGPLLLVANEFLDALPIVPFECHAGRLHERKVALDGSSLAITREPTPDEALPGAQDGDVKEVCPVAYAMTHALARRIAHSGGAALFIDYGYYPSAFGDTLQALRRHRPVSISETPGEVDLTAHVDFDAVARAAQSGGAAAHGPVSQAQFLIQLGITAREATLSKKATPEQQIAIRSGCRRLIEPAEMGTLFKVLALTQKDAPVPAGLGA